MHIGVAGAAVSKPVNQPRIAMKIEDDRFVNRKQRVEIPIRQAVRMLCAAL
jgi:hypothetical protein